ncbi:cadherin-89D isoform X2 [Folsomia candida]|uniref:cadherin-89D isoform X2 n=1 Tax=Folsomia candida TaxID=158441 RepID=UPI0016051892|nr:cadherin-89D isoform X2 [Folsomia candida]
MKINSTPRRNKEEVGPRPIKNAKMTTSQQTWSECRSWRRFSRSGTFPIILLMMILAAESVHFTKGCQFLPMGEYLRFVRVPENLVVGEKIMTLEVLQKHNLTLESIDKGDDAKYFALSESSSQEVDLLLARSLENIVDNDSPQNILKFRIVCYPSSGSDRTPSFLQFTAYIEDLNDHAPIFLHGPNYFVSVDELTPVGLTVFRGIRATDLDKPNTGNSDVHFSIVDGNDDGKFGLESSQNPALVVKKSLDYDAGDREFKLKIMASDRGNPPLSSFAFISVKVIDNDDLPVVFTKPIYKTQIKEFYPFNNKTIRQEVMFPSSSRIQAFDQDLAINATVEYAIVGGNEGAYFDIETGNGSLYLVREVDRESLASNVFNLQLRARQTNDLTKMGMALAEIEILDLNDCLPQFEVDVYNISIMENLPNGFSVLHVTATDADQGENAEFLYKLEDRTKAFQIDPRSGWLTVRDQSQLDREKMSQINLKVIADEKVGNVAFGTTKSYASVEVHLLDANDANPTFIPSNLYKFQVTIDSEIGSVVGQVTAEDPDLGGNGKIAYEIQKPNGTTEELPFDIDAGNGYIFLLERPLPKLHYTLLVEASDQPSNPSERRYSLAVVQIDVVKAGAGHSPEFIGSPYEFWVGSHVGVGTSVGHVKVNHLDPKYTVYDLLHSYYEGVPFAIEERTGIIAVVDDLSKYTRTTYEFEAYVTDSRHTLTTNLTIHIVDPHEAASASEGGGESGLSRNGNSRRAPIELKVKENVGGAIVANLKTLLSDTLRDVRGMEFILANYDARDKFAISSDGTIYTLKPLDREEKSKHLLTVISQSRGVIQGQGVYEIVVNLEDENDNSPKFDRQVYEGFVRENSLPGTPLSMEIPVTVIDPDDGPNAQFHLELKGDGADRFLVNPKTGKIVVGNVPLDREEKHLYSLKLIATDTGNKSSTAKINIHIQDTNDNAPVFFQNIVLDPPELDLSNGPRELLRSASQPISVEISNAEPIQIPETVAVGSRIARVLASDKDTGDNSKIFYRLVSENSNPIGGKFSYLTDKQYLYSRNKDKHFIIERTTGEISVAKPLRPDTEYALNISASDRGGLRAYTGIKIVVQDVNDHVPKFDRPWYAFDLLEGTYDRGEVGKVTAKDGDTGLNGEILYSLQPKVDPSTTDLEYSDTFLPFNIDPKSGMIFVVGTIDRETKVKYSFYAVATDKGQPQMESMVDIDVNILDVNDNAPKFHGYMTTVKVGSKSVPVYRTSIKSNLIPAGAQVFKVSANDSDSPANGNGLVLFHLANNHKTFYIDSKNGTISTLTQLDYDKSSITSPEYNLTVVASDLGKPSQSSTAWVLIRLSGTKMSTTTDKKPSESGNDLERMFQKEVYTYYVPHRYNTPFFLTKMNVTDRYKRYPTEYHLFGGDKIIENFRIGPKSGEIYVIKMLKPDTTYDMLVRAFNSQQPSKFDVRQGSLISDRYLEHNEALIRVELVKAPPPPPLLPPLPNDPIGTSSGHKPRVVYKTTSTTTATKASSLVPIISHPNSSDTSSSPSDQSQSPSKIKPKSSSTTNNNRPSPTSIVPKVIIANSPRNDSDNEIIPGSNKTNKSHHKNSYFYAGEIAVLTMSCVVFLGGLVAAISIACVRRRKNRRRRRLSHIPAIPVEVRLQKQPMGSRLVLGSRPMALPGEPLPNNNNNGTESSDATSETYTDGLPELGHHQRSASFVNVNVHKTGLSVCPDCRKIRKPNNNNHSGASHNNNNNNHVSNNNRLLVNGVARGVRDRDRGKQSRHPREVSLPSSNDSGIDGSDGQCHCCQSHNSSSESGRDHYEDSLMPHMNARVTSKSFRRKRNANQTPYPQQHNRGAGSRFNGRMGEGIVIL